MDKIDFVLLWVDGADPKWLEEKNQYSPVKVDYSSGNNRFRDWDNLQYWFRGVEKFAPWVNNIYFITWGHLPAWLDVNNPKIKVINHKNFIPEKYLPTFNSNAIEFNLHRIGGLSEQFVLFNDDTFLIKPVKREDFFVGGKPRDNMVLNPILPIGEKGRISQTNLNNMNVVNTHFKKSEFVKKHFGLLYNYRYGTELIRTLALSMWSSFVGFQNPHIPQAHLKSTFKHLWNVEGEKLDATCCNKFRGLNDLNHWLMRYWNLCTANFVPRKCSFAKYFNLTNKNQTIYNFIRDQKTHMICVNDFNDDIDFETVKKDLNACFEEILPDKSAYEL